MSELLNYLTIDNSVSRWLEAVLGINALMQLKVIATVFLAVILGFIRWLLLKLIFRHYKDVKLRYRWRKIITYSTAFLGVFLIGRMWFAGFQSLATFLGLLSAGIAVAMKEVILNFAGWIFVLWRKPFQVGDRIQIGPHSGDVIDLRLFQFTVLEVGNWVHADQSTGRVIHIPNGKVFTEMQANYSQGFQHIWNEIPVLVTFESNWKRAKEILLEIIANHTKQFSKSAERKLRQAARSMMIFYKTLTPTVYTKGEESGVSLTIRYLCEPRKRRDTESAIWEEILEEFEKCGDIELAYPTERRVNYVSEGKKDIRP